MFEISVGAYSCAMHSRLKAAPAIALSEREIYYKRTPLEPPLITQKYPATPHFANGGKIRIS